MLARLAQIFRRETRPRPFVRCIVCGARVIIQIKPS